MPRDASELEQLRNFSLSLTPPTSNSEIDESDSDLSLPLWQDDGEDVGCLVDADETTNEHGGVIIAEESKETFEERNTRLKLEAV